MKVVQVFLFFVLFFILLSTACGIIRDKDGILIGKEDHRGAEKLEKSIKVDETKEGSTARSVRALGQTDKGQLDYQHGDYAGGYGAAGADTPVGLHGYNARPHQEGNYGHGQDGYGHGYPSGGASLNYDYGGGGLESYGHSGGGIAYGPSEGGIGYGHSEGGVEYGHSGGGHNLGHSEGGIDYDYGHTGVLGYENSGAGLNYVHRDVAYGYGGGSYGGSGLGSIFGKKLPLKKLLLPIAGLVLFGAAAALSTNPVLLQLGTISSRRRRSISKKPSVKFHPRNPYVTPIRL